MSAQSRKPVKKKLTIKEAKFVKAKADGKTDIEAGLIAGAKSKQAASKYGQRLSKNVQIQELLQEELIKQGITPKEIIKPVVKALSAKRVVQIEGDFFQTEVDDVDLQLKGHDRAVKLLGLGKDNETPQHLHFHNHMTSQKDKYGL